MLDQKDFAQIRKIIREEVETESKQLNQDLRAEMKLSRMEIQTDIAGLSDRIKNVEISNSGLAKELKQIKKDLKEIDKKLEFSVNFMDREYLAL